MLLTKGKASLTATAETSSDQRIEALDDLDFIEMLNSVDVGKASELIQKFQTKEGRAACSTENITRKESAQLKLTAIKRFF